MSLKTEVLEKSVALITAAFGMVAALAWNAAIVNLFNRYYAAGEGLWALFVYAVAVTVIAVLVILLVARSAAKAKEADERLIRRLKAEKKALEEKQA